MERFKKIRILAVITVITFFTINTGCKRFDIVTKTIFTYPGVSGVTDSSATVQTEILEVGKKLKTFGHCYGTYSNPTVNDSKTIRYASDASDGYLVDDQILGLEEKTTYYIRAYAEEDEVRYSVEQDTFTTGSKNAPETFLTEATNLTQTSVTLNGMVHSKEIETAVFFQYGQTTEYGTEVEASPATVTGSINLPVSADLTGLEGNTTYNYRIKAENSEGTSYSENGTFTTSDDPQPTVTTNAASNVNVNTATLNGQVNANGNETTVTFEYGETDSYGNVDGLGETINGNSFTDVSVDLTGLTGSTTYHYRIVATNAGGTSYGADLTFTTSDPSLPTVTSIAATNIAINSSTCGGNLSDNGGSPITSLGIVWGTSSNPTLSSSYTDVFTGTEPTTFSSDLTGLTPNTTYHFRAYATNSAGTAYGDDATFTTLNSIPTITTNDVSSIGYTTATCGGNITYEGSSAITARGVCWSTSTNPVITDDHTTDGTGTGSFASSLTGLDEETPYYIRAYATNSQGTGYGEEKTFTTLRSPYITVTAPTATDDWQMYTTQTITWDDNITENVKIELYKGVSLISVIAASTESDGSYSWTLPLTYTPATDYNIKITSITNGSLSDIGNNFEISFYQGTVDDIESNSYNTIQIGEQIWMAENLKTTRYRNNNPIYYPGDIPINWENNTTGAYAKYLNTDLMYNTYGALYNWHAVDNAGGLCPSGWHVPTDAEWTTLTTYLTINGHSGTEGTALKSETGWNLGNGTDNYGFKALPGGYRDNLGAYDELLDFGYFWSATEDVVLPANAKNRLLDDQATVQELNQSKPNGYSVRCVKD